MIYNISELVEKYKGLRQSKWISLGEKFQSRAESVLWSIALTEWFPFGIAL